MTGTSVSEVADLAPSAARSSHDPARDTREAYRPDIDGLRGVAVLLVVGYHAWPALLPGGYLGVDVFFVISGYLITRIIASELRNGTFSFRTFYARRARRLLPALLVVLPVASILGWYIQLAEGFRLLGRQVVGAMFFVSNLLLMAEAGYFDTAAETKPLLHLWSLGVEEQFYLTFPLLLFFVRQRRRSYMAVLATVGAGSLALHLFVDAVNPTAAFYLPLTRAWELMAGAVLAESVARIPEPLRAGGSRTANLCSVAGAGALGIAAALTMLVHGSSVLWLILTVGGTVLLIWAGPRSILNRRVLSHPGLVSVGLFSYPLYLWHWPLLASLRDYYGHDGASAYIPAVVGLSFVLAWTTYRGIERPLRARMLEDKRWMGATATAVAVVILAGAVIWGRDGYPDRVSPRLRALAEFAKSPHEPYRNQTCETMLHGIQGLDVDACLSSLSATPSIVLLGDSHANQYYRSLARKLPGTSVLHVGRWSCLPFSSKTHQTDSCQQTLAQMRDYITHERGISTVVLAGYWDYLMAGRFEKDHADFRQPAPVDSAETEVFLRTGHEIVTAFLAAGKRVVLLLDAPNLSFNVQQCIYDPTGGKSALVPPGCALNRRAFESKDAQYDAVMKRFTSVHPGVEVFDPRSVLCDDELCHATQDGRPLYFDSDHLSIRGADLVIERMIAAGLLDD